MGRHDSGNNSDSNTGGDGNKPQGGGHSGGDNTRGNSGDGRK